MKKLFVLLTPIFILFCGMTLLWGQQTVSEEAQRHFDRGKAFADNANSPDDYALVINEFEQARKLAPKWPEVYFNLGMAQVKVNKYSDAIRNLEKYLRLAPDASDAEKVKNFIIELKGRIEKKIVSFEAQQHFNRGKAFATVANSPSDNAAAIKEFERAKKLAPDWPEVYYNLGRVQATAGKFSAAKKTLKQYVLLAPDANDVKKLSDHIIDSEVEAKQKSNENKKSASKEFHKPYDPNLIHSFITLCYEFSGQQKIVDKDSLLSQKVPLPGFSLGWFSAGRGDIQPELRFGYRRLKADQIGFGLQNIPDFSFHFGFRFYPSFPTFSLSKIPVRLTLSALSGINWLTPGAWNDAFTFSALLSGGLSISSSDSRYGLLIEFVYQPISRDIKLKQVDGSLHGTLRLKPSWCIRIACLFSPLPF